VSSDTRADIRRHVAVLAPLPLELEAVVAAFGLAPSDDPDLWTGHLGASAVTAVRAGMGPEAAAAAAGRLLEGPPPPAGPVAHLMSVGICGGLDPDIDVGTVLRPERVVDHATGAVYRHTTATGADRQGTLVTTAEVHFDDGLSRRMLAEGGVGVDMESSAVARVAEERGSAWSVHRAISDRWVDGLLDPRVVALTAVDGSMDLEGLTRLLADEPDLVPRLERLADDTVRAARQAAEDAVRGCLALDGPGAG
jgi:hypothetical protein